MKKTTIDQLAFNDMFQTYINDSQTIDKDSYFILQNYKRENNQDVYIADHYLFGKFFEQLEISGDKFDVWLLEKGYDIPETPKVTFNINDNYNVESLTVKESDYGRVTLRGPMYNDTIIIQNKKLVIPEDITAFESANLAKFLAWVIYHNQNPEHVSEFIKNHKIERLFISY